MDCNDCSQWVTVAVPNAYGDGYGGNFSYCQLKQRGVGCPYDECDRDDCQRDRDSCVDCFEGSLYRSPAQPDWREPL